MPEPISPYVLTSALLSLLSNALEQDEMHHLASDRFRADLRGLQARVAGELDQRTGRTRLRLAVDPSELATDD